MIRVLDMSENRTGWAQNIPPAYKRKSENRGRLEGVRYPTIDYTNNAKITKEAVVYLPFGYDEDEKYCSCCKCKYCTKNNKNKN